MICPVLFVMVPFKSGYATNVVFVTRCGSEQYRGLWVGVHILYVQYVYHDCTSSMYAVRQVRIGASSNNVYGRCRDFGLFEGQGHVYGIHDLFKEGLV